MDIKRPPKIMNPGAPGAYNWSELQRWFYDVYALLVSLVTSAINLEIKPVNTSDDYTAHAGDFISVDATTGNKTITAPIAPNCKQFFVRKVDSTTNTITITGVGVIGSQGTTIHCIYNGSSWVAA